MEKTYLVTGKSLNNKFPVNTGAISSWILNLFLAKRKANFVDTLIKKDERTG